MNENKKLLSIIPSFEQYRLHNSGIAKNSYDFWSCAGVDAAGTLLLYEEYTEQLL